MSAGRFHLTFPDHLLNEPILYRVASEFGVVTNIRRANIDEHMAWVILEIAGPDDAVGRAVSWLAQQGIEIDRIREDEPAR